METVTTGFVPSPRERPSKASRALRATLRKLLGTQETRLVERIEKMVAAIDEIRFATSPSLQEEMHRMAAFTTRLFLEQIVEERPATKRELGALDRWAGACAAEGVPLHGYLRCYRDGMWLLWEELVRASAGRTDVKEELLRRASWVFRRIEVISVFVAEAFVAAKEARMRDRDHALRSLFDVLIDGGALTDAEIARRAREEGVDLAARTFVLALPFVDPTSQEIGGIVRTIARRLPNTLGLSADVIVEIERPRESVILVPADRIDDLRRPLQRVAADVTSKITSARGVALGVSGVVAGVEGIRRGYLEAKAAIDALGPGTGARVAHYPDLALDAVLQPESLAGRRLIDDTIGPLAASPEAKERLETISAYFRANLHVKVAAARLGIHPNTLAYRIRRVEELVGVSFNDPDQRFKTEIALRLLALRQRRASRHPEEGGSWISTRKRAGTSVK